MRPQRAPSWFLPFVAGCTAGAVVACFVSRQRRRAASLPKRALKLKRHLPRGAPGRGGNINTQACKREIIEDDALVWLQQLPNGRLPAGTCVITGIPDISEVDPEGQLGIDGWKGWFQRAAGLIVRALPEDGAAIFMHTDVKLPRCVSKAANNSRHYWEWVDKSHLVLLAAAEVPRVRLLWHKIVCAGLVEGGGRGGSVAAYSHALCFTVGESPEPLDGVAFPDVSRKGMSTYSNGFGAQAVEAACRYMKARGCKLILDPFCGEGSVLAVANTLGIDSMGVEICKKRARLARVLDGEQLLVADRAERS